MLAVTADSVVVELLARTDGYTANINGAATATDTAMSRIERSAVRAENQIVRSAGAIANAQRNLGRQISDIGVGLAGGQSPFLILAQQAPQVADALADTGGKAATVAAFFAGPWGAALLAAGSALSVLASKALESGETLESLTRKLEDNAIKSRLAEQAQAVFTSTLYGAAQASAELNKNLEKQNQTQLQVAQSALAAAQALRQSNIQNLRTELSRATIAQAQVRAASNTSNFVGGGVAGSASVAQGQAQTQAANSLAKATERVAVARKGLADAESAVVQASIPLIDMRAAAAADAGAAATDRHAQALGRLRSAYVQAQAAAKNDREREAAVRAYRVGRTQIDVQLAKDQEAVRDSKKKGPSAESLARKAEAARIRDVRNNEAYNNELEALNQAIIQATRAQEVDAGKLAELSRQEVASALSRRLNKINADEAANRYTAEQAANLRKLAKEAADAQNLNISNDEIRRRSDEARATSQVRLSVESEQLQAQLSISESLQERKALEKQLLDIRFKQLRIEQDAILQDTTGRYTDAQRTQAKVTLDALPGLQAAGNTAVDQRYRSPYEQYRRSLSNADDLAASIDRVKINTLEAVTDELTNATKAALGLKGAFGDIVGQLIRIGIQRRLIGPLADALFGREDGSSSGGLGRLFESIGGKSSLTEQPGDSAKLLKSLGSLIPGLFGRASGGYMAPNSVARVNEGRGGVELLRMGSQGGTVIPLGATAAQRQGNRTTVISAPQFNLRGAVITADLYADMQRISEESATRAGGAAFVASQRSTPGTLAQYDKLEG